MMTIEDMDIPSHVFVAKLLPHLDKIGNDFPMFMDDLMTQKEVMKDGGKICFAIHNMA